MNLEQKLEYLEGEMGLMKGEIKQTLVDLREFIMKQGAPFVVAGAPPQVSAAEPGEDGTEEAAAGPSPIKQVSLAPEPQVIDDGVEGSGIDDGGLSPADIQQMLDEARAKGREEASPTPLPDDDLPQVQVIPSAWDAAGEIAEPAPPQGTVEERTVVPGLPATGDPYPDSSALDANLLTNLTRWVGGVKRRLGSEQLAGLLEIYKMTGHLPQVVENLIYFLAGLDALPDESSDQVFTLDDLMDSLLQLHAVVYGPGYASRGSLLSSLAGQSLEDAQ